MPNELTLNSDGTITVNPGAPSNSYSLVYQICENGASPANCSTANVTLVVANIIDSVLDDFSGSPLTIGDSSSSVITNDTLDGILAVIGNNPGEVSISGVSVTSELTLNNDGTITVNESAPSGTYTLTYQICENDSSPLNCDTETVTIVVSNIIDSVSDDFSGSPITIDDSSPSIIGNDTLDDKPVVIGGNPGEVTLTPVSVPNELTLNGDGTITVNEATPSGTYTLTYQICENNSSPSNCDTETVIIVVSNVLDSVGDDFSGSPITIDDSSPSIIGNDTLDNKPFVIGGDPGEVSLTPISVPSELTLNGDGTVTVNEATPSGTYTLTYQICENNSSPINCDTETVTIVVSNIIDSVADDFTNNPLTVGDTSISVVNNDTLDEASVVIGSNPGEISIDPISVPNELTLNPDGTVTVNSPAPSGTYTLSYKICENNSNPINCDTETVTILVSNVLGAVDDDFYKYSTNNELKFSIGYS